MLLWHHLFQNQSKSCVYLITVHSVPLVKLIADYSKCCVAIFIFISGYGLYLSYSLWLQKNKSRSVFLNDLVFVKNRVLKLMSNYWFVFILFVPLGLLFERRFYEIYGSNPFHYIANILGISYLLYSNQFTMNVTWWYVSYILVYYAVYPVLYRIYKVHPELVLALSIGMSLIPHQFVPRSLTIYLAAFILGTYFADKQLFERSAERFNTNLKKMVFTFVPLAVFAAVRYFYKQNDVRSAMRFDALFIIPILLISFLLVSHMPVVNRVLEELGKKSGLIFLFHTFIFSYYFKSFIYSFKYPVVIFIVLLAICYIIALLLELLMKYTGYKNLINRITMGRH